MTNVTREQLTFLAQFGPFTLRDGADGHTRITFPAPVTPEITHALSVNAFTHYATRSPRCLIIIAMAGPIVLRHSLVKSYATENAHRHTYRFASIEAMRTELTGPRGWYAGTVNTLVETGMYQSTAGYRLAGYGTDLEGEKYIPGDVLRDLYTLTDEGSEATEIGISAGWAHANYVNAYGGDTDETPEVPLMWASVPSFYLSGWETGVERYLNDQWQDGTARDDDAQSDADGPAPSEPNEGTDGAATGRTGALTDAERAQLLDDTSETGRHWRSWQRRPLSVGDRVRLSDRVPMHPADAPHPTGTVVNVPADGIVYGSGGFAISVQWDGLPHRSGWGPDDLVLIDARTPYSPECATLACHNTGGIDLVWRARSDGPAGAFYREHVCPECAHGYLSRPALWIMEVPGDHTSADKISLTVAPEYAHDNTLTVHVWKYSTVDDRQHWAHMIELSDGTIIDAGYTLETPRDGDHVSAVMALVSFLASEAESYHYQVTQVMPYRDVFDVTERLTLWAQMIEPAHRAIRDTDHAALIEHCNETSATPDDLIGAYLDTVGDTRDFEGSAGALRWNAHVTHARLLGAEHGRNAATWVDVDERNAQVLIDGFDNGDPEVYDQYLPRDGMSGEYANDYGPSRLYVELGLDADGSDDSDSCDLITAYQDAFTQAAEFEITRVARSYLS